MRRFTLALMVASLAGCHHHPRLSLNDCRPVGAQRAAAMPLDQLNGTFDVVFVATAGTRAGQQAPGRLVLRPQDAGLVAVPNADTSVVVTQPTIGQLDLAVADIGATQMGDPMSDSAATPGVGLYVTRVRGGEVTGVVARVGSASNIRNQTLFDGGYFTLHIAGVSRDGLWGTWRSSAGTGFMTAEPAGHFCALRRT